MVPVLLNPMVTTIPVMPVPVSGMMAQIPMVPDDEDAFADACDEAGRVASRPGYPAEPATRSRPFGRVSLAPPLPPVAARSACPAARFAHRRCRTDAMAARFDRIVHRTAVVSSRRRCALRSSGTSPRSPSPAAPAAGPASAPVPAPVRAPPPPPPAAPPAAHTPRRLPSAGFPGVDSPYAHAASRCLPRRRGRLCSHTRRTLGAPLPPLRTGAMGGPPRVNNHTPSMP